MGRPVLSALLSTVAAIACQPAASRVSSEACQQWHETVDQSLSSVEQQVRELGLPVRAYAITYWELAKYFELEEDLAECAGRRLLADEILLALEAESGDTASPGARGDIAPAEAEASPAFAYSNLTPGRSKLSDLEELIGTEGYRWFLSSRPGASKDAKNDSDVALQVADEPNAGSPAHPTRTVTLAMAMGYYQGGFLRPSARSKTVFAKVESPLSAVSRLMTVGVEFPMRADRRISELLEKIGSPDEVIRVRDHTDRGRPFIVTHYFWFGGAVANTFHLEHPRPNESQEPIFQQVEYATPDYVRWEYEQMKRRLEPVAAPARGFDDR